LAARGTRNLDAGEEPIPDSSAVERLRQVARKIRTRTVTLATLATVLALVAPAW
jgi:hypothetical protein